MVSCGFKVRTAIKHSENIADEIKLIRRMISRRKIFPATILVLLLLGALGFFFYHQNNHLEVSELQVTSDRAGTLKIVHLSDLHNKQYGTHNEDLEKRIEDLHPDLIVVTGDMLDVSNKNLEETKVFMGALGHQHAPLVYVFGNHEPRAEKRNELKKELEKENITVLKNEILSLDIHGSEIHILGLDEWLREAANIDAGPLFEELSQMSGLRIVLSHHTERYALAGKDSYDQYDFDFMFSGHAHGGQWNLPLIGGLVAPNQGLFPRHYRGMYDDRLIVSAGLGNGTPIPRLFNRPQIVVLAIN